MLLEEKKGSSGCPRKGAPGRVKTVSQEAGVLKRGGGGGEEADGEV